MELGANELTGYLMVSKQRRPWTGVHRLQTRVTTLEKLYYLKFLEFSFNPKG